MLVDMDKNKKSDDELDAVAIALTAFAHIRIK
jgi:Holliday junction resolvasome RuvABC endonuclease subunit